MVGTSGTYKPAKDRRKTAPVKRVAISPEARQAYEEEVKLRDQRERDHSRFLPEEHKGKR